MPIALNRGYGIAPGPQLHTRYRIVRAAGCAGFSGGTVIETADFLRIVEAKAV